MDNPVNENPKQLLTRDQTIESLELCENSTSDIRRHGCIEMCLQTLLKEALRHLQNDEQSTRADINKTGGDLKT